MHVLFTFVGGAGHYEPLVPLARAAWAAGHTVSFACRPSMSALVEADGFPTHAIGEAVPDLQAVIPLAPYDAAHEDRVLRDGFALHAARERATDLVALCHHLRPDVLVRDEVDYGSAIAAEHLGLAHASVLVLVDGSFARPDLLRTPLTLVRSEFGLPADPRLDMLGRHLTIAPFPPSFRHPGFPVPATTHHIRPAVLDPASLPPAAPDLDLLSLDRPTVYVTLGTIFNMESGDLFSRVLAGVRELPVGVIATVGRQFDPALLGPQPANVHIERFLPNAAVLPRCDLVVSHGGSGTVVGALAHGLPAVLLPMGADQPHNAARCEALGVARVLDPVTATPAEIGAAVAAVLADERFRLRARALQRETQALPGAAGVIPLLEAIVGGRSIS